MMMTTRTPSARFYLCLGAVYLPWTVWCLLMKGYGAPFDLPIPRALLRFAAIIIPATVYARIAAPASRDRFRFTSNWRSGIATGIVVGFAWAILHVTQKFTMPNSVDSWLNVIVLAPISEEILFRSVILDRFLTKTAAIPAIVNSAGLFALFHLPWWWISGDMMAGDLVVLLGKMFAYGVVFGVLYYRTRSIWASLIPHMVNNVIGEAIRS